MTLPMTQPSTLMDPEVLTDPYPFYAQLRAEAPIYWDQGMKAWLVSHYADATAAEIDPRFSLIPPHDPDWAPRHQLLKILSGNLVLFNDLPAHTRIRGLMQKAFDSRLPGMHERIQGAVDSLLDKVQASGRMDIFNDMAVPLPLIVQSEFIGIPFSDSAQLAQWVSSVANFLFGTGYVPTTPEDDQQVLQDLQSLVDYFRLLIEQRRREPKDDLITALVQVEEQGDKLKSDELIAGCVILVTGSFLAIPVALSNCMVGLLTHADQLQALRDNPALIESAVEELLRYQPQVQCSARRASEDVELHGEVIRQDQIVLIILGSANRDERHFPGADKLDITRADNRHLSFGHGPHGCLAAALARMHLQTAVSTMVRRLNGLHLGTDQLVWLGPPVAPLFRSVGTLPVTFE